MDIRHDETIHETLRQTPHGPWPEDSLARVRYWVYQDEANYKREMQRLFEGATWNFVCFEADIPNKGDYRTNHIGILPVIVVRDADGSINCFENRCAHRGALIAFDDSGNVQNSFKCIYHAWSYDLAGNRLECRATTRKGTPCQRTPLAHNGYCPSHQHLADEGTLTVDAPVVQVAA